MYLFSRRARLASGNLRESAAWAVAITEKVNQITELNVGLWASVFSPGLGDLVWATFVEDLLTLENAEAKLMVDDGYVALTDQGAAFSDGSGIDDTLSQVVFGEIDPNRQVTYVTVVESTIAGGKLARGMELGAQIAQRASKITRVPTAFMADTTGSYGGVRWITGHENVQQLQDAEAKLAADPSFTAFVDKEAAGVYMEAPGVTTQRIARRIV
jgi:hypothetical protein